MHGHGRGAVCAADGLHNFRRQAEAHIFRHDFYFFDAIEAEIKRARIEVQALLWIETLRDQAEIEIRPNCLK